MVDSDGEVSDLVLRWLGKRWIESVLYDRLVRWEMFPRSVRGPADLEVRGVARLEHRITSYRKDTQ
jgi:hypothetical protein